MNTTAVPTSETAAPTPMTRSDLLKRLEEIKDDIEFYKEWMKAEFHFDCMRERNLGPSYAIFRDDEYQWEEVAGCSDDHIAEKLLVAERRAHRRYCREELAELLKERKALSQKLRATPA